MDKLSITEMVVITVSLALFMYKTELYKKFLEDENISKPSVVSNFTSENKKPDVEISDELISQINNQIKPFDKYDKLTIVNQDRKKRLNDEMKEATGDYSEDSRPIIPLIKQKSFAAEAAKIRSAAYNINSVKKYYTEELDKAQSTEWMDVDNEMDDKLYGIQLEKLSGLR